MSLSTSGGYEKFFFAGGRAYSHIMDPRTGHPADGNVLGLGPGAENDRQRGVDEAVLHQRTRLGGQTHAGTLPCVLLRRYAPERVRLGAATMMLCTLLLLTVLVFGGQDFSNLTVEPVAADFPGGEGPVWSREGFLDLQRLQQGPPVQVHARKSAGSLSRGHARRKRERDGSTGATLLVRIQGTTRDTDRSQRQGRRARGQIRGQALQCPERHRGSARRTRYFTDPLFTPLDQRDLDFYGVYHVTPAGQIEAVARMQTRPNGIALSPDGKVLYVANSDDRNVRAYDLAPNGRASNERIAIAKLEAGPDGLRTDVKGNLYLAVRGGVVVYSPEGKLLGKINAPVNPRNIAFGDKDFRTLYLVGNSIFRVRVDIPGSVQVLAQA